MIGWPIALHHMIWLILWLSFSSDLSPLFLGTSESAWRHFCLSWVERTMLQAPYWVGIVEISDNTQGSLPLGELSKPKCLLVQRLRNLGPFPFASCTFSPEVGHILKTACWWWNWRSEWPQHIQSSCVYVQYLGLHTGGAWVKGTLVLSEEARKVNSESTGSDSFSKASEIVHVFHQNL